MTNLNNLNEGDSEQVSGGTKCDVALATGAVYQTFANILLALGKTSESAFYSGMAAGTYGTGCPK